MTRSRALGLVIAALPAVAAGGEWSEASCMHAPDKRCEVWNEFPEAGETASWNGYAMNGRAEGVGGLEWRKNGTVTQRYFGRLHEGKKEGIGGYYEWSDGRRYKGGFVDNRMQGRGLFRERDGTLYDGFWIQGIRASDRAYQAHLEATFDRCTHVGDSDPRFSVWRGIERSRRGCELDDLADVGVRDLVLAGIRLQDFYRKYRSRLQHVTVTRSPSDGSELLTLPGLVIRLVPPWETANRDEWVVDSIRLTKTGARTGRGVEVGAAGEEVERVYADTRQQPRIGPDTGLLAFGPDARLSFEADELGGQSVASITLSISPVVHDDCDGEEGEDP